jgi:hypothetical protein
MENGDFTAIIQDFHSEEFDFKGNCRIREQFKGLRHISSSIEVLPERQDKKNQHCITLESSHDVIKKIIL